MKNPLLNWFTPDEQKVLIFLIFFGFLGLFLHDNRLNADSEKKKADSLKTIIKKDYEIKYDLRIVTKKQLVTIPGIGPKKADVILDYRKENGFKSKRDLLKVKGIGEKTYTKYKKYFIDFGEPEKTKKDTVLNEKKGKNISLKKNEIKQKDRINLNTADVEQLTELKGIGPKKAEQIIALRKELGGFTSVEQLLKVKGIGSKTLAKIKDKIFIDKGKTK